MGPFLNLLKRPYILVFEEDIIASFVDDIISEANDIEEATENYKLLLTGNKKW